MENVLIVGLGVEVEDPMLSSPENKTGIFFSLVWGLSMTVALNGGGGGGGVSSEWANPSVEGQ